MPTVVVGYDGSAQARAAIRHAVGIAEGGKIIAVHARQAPPPRMTSRWQELIEQEQADKAQSVLDSILLEGNDELAQADWEGRLARGRPAQALLDVAHEVAADAIVVGSHGYGPITALVGSVSHELLRISDIPVTVISPPTAERMGTGEPAAEAG